VPNVVRVVLDGTIRAELTCVADVSPALFCECVLILVVAVELELGVHVALEVIHQEVLIRMALTPIDVVDDGIVQLLEHAGAAIVQRAVYKSFHDALDLRVVVVDVIRNVVVVLFLLNLVNGCTRSPCRLPVQSLRLRRPAYPA